MFRPILRPLAMVAVLSTATSIAQAQLFNRGGCSSCGQHPMPMMTPALPAPVSYGMDACNTCAQPVAVNPCAVCAQPVAVLQPQTQTVYREVPVTKYRPVQKTVQRPVMKTVYEQRPVTAYRQVMETKTVEVPHTAYQTVTECQQRVQNRSYWQTSYQAVPKMSPCQYDPNPSLLGWMNRGAYSLRMAVTPNYLRQRQYVPNMVAYNVPVSRTVAVPSTRQVTYNVARLEPYQSTQTVAVAKMEYEEVPVTAYEPYTERVTMAVGTTTTYAYVNPFGGATATALAPIPDTAIRSRSAAVPTPAGPPPTAASPDDGLFKPLSYPRPQSAEQTPSPNYFDAKSQPEADEGEVIHQVAHLSGWRPRRPSGNGSAEVPSSEGPALTGNTAEIAMSKRK